MAAPGLLKIRKIWDKGYGIINFVHDVTNKISSHDSNHIVDMVMWTKSGNSNTSLREVMKTSILKGFHQKNRFFWRLVLVQVQEVGIGTRYKLEFYASVTKGLKIKFR